MLNLENLQTYLQIINNLLIIFFFTRLLANFFLYLVQKFSFKFKNFLYFFPWLMLTDFTLFYFIDESNKYN